MAIPKKWLPVLSFLMVFLFVRFSRKVIWIFEPLWTETPNQPSFGDSPQLDAKPRRHYQAPLLPISETEFKNGTIKPVGASYTKTIVIPRTKAEDASWVHGNFGGDKYIRTSIYSVEDSSADLHPPRNKGHEVMIYLSYIIDHYDSLSDVNIFMHSHRYSWHNDELMDHDAVQMISRLSAERVQREGYMNMRCTNFPIPQTLNF